MIFAGGFKVIGGEGFQFHMTWRYYVLKQILGNVLSVIYMQEGGHFVLHCRLRNGSSLFAVVFPTGHRHFVHFLKAEIQQTSTASAR